MSSEGTQGTQRLPCGMALGVALCALFVLSACGPSGLDREAQAAANNYLDRALSNCDGHRYSRDVFSPLPFYGQNVTEYEGLTLQVVRSQLTSAQSLDGFEWVGTIWIRCAAHRNRAGRGWTDWQNGCKNDWTPDLPNEVGLNKRSGQWYLSFPAFGVMMASPGSADFPLEKYHEKSVDCASLSSTSSNEATSADSSRPDSAPKAPAGQTHNFDDHLEQDVPPAAASLRVNDDHGAVRVSVANDNKITAVVRKRVGAESQSDADRYNKQTSPTITMAGNIIILDARTQAAGDYSVQSDLDISIPRKMELHIVSRSGDVSVIGRDGEVEITTQDGDVSMQDVVGNVKLILEKSSARVEHVTGDLHVDGRMNKVSVTDVKGGAQFEGEFQESVKLARISKSVAFKSSRTDLEFLRLDGDLSLDSDDLHADQITGPLHLTTRSKQIRLEEVSGDVRLQDEHGGIEVSMRSLGNVQIDSRNGDIHLSVPDKAGFHLDARTRDGKIQSDFHELKIDNNEHEAKASGTVGNGASHIVLNNEHEGIEIRKTSAKASVAPPAPPAPRP